MSAIERIQLEAITKVTFLPLADPALRRADPVQALYAARRLRALVITEELDAVKHARAAGSAWSEIGLALGMSRQACHERFSVLVRLADGPHLDVDQLLDDPARRAPRPRRAPKTGGRQVSKRRRRR